MTYQDKALIIDIPLDNAFTFLANMENENLWHPKGNLIYNKSKTKPGIGTVYEFVADGKRVKLKFIEYEPNKILANTIEYSDKPLEKWRGEFISISINKTQLIQTWEIDDKNLSDREKLDWLEKMKKYSKYLNPYLKKGIE